MNGAPLEGPHITEITTPTEDIISSILQVSPDYGPNPEGVYTCQATNTYGKALSAPATLLEASKDLILLGDKYLNL